MPTPLQILKSRLTLGEGNTPLTELATIGGGLPLRKLYAKLEFLKPHRVIQGPGDRNDAFSCPGTWSLPR
ncbi:MAG: hypothetical protein CM1200mP27_11440 [Chloroflexota bacterium]|nr:MAG: hypothetical protein CM1200mP27_11440 [Chloroflexota bacterium]